MALTSLSQTYDPKLYEPTVYGLWEAAGSFRPSGATKKFSIAMPPPNANGNLHIGHGLTLNLQDILIRYHRMRGYSAWYIPGADHAGFETWAVYEKQLAATGKSRFDFSRDQIYDQVWNFVEEHRGSMELQVRAMGASASWDDLVFTLDKRVVETVYETFERLWRDGLIYRGERIVNYCTYHQTGFADIEVVHKNEISSLWHISYPVIEEMAEITVATTRPETLLGDTAIAVHPSDERYKHLIGKHVQVPVCHREIPIIADEAVDPGFGTGAVKVTPAHDPNDFEIGERHNLERIQVIGYDDTMTSEIPSPVAGMSVLDARKKIVELLKNEERLGEVVRYEHSVGHCYKCGNVIQPLLKEQWFMKMSGLAERAIEAIEAKRIKFTPISRGKVLVQYLRGLRDWNLSRQIPWGIPIPMFQNVADHNDWIYDDRVDSPTIEVDGKTYRREEDTFDTWFSSGQWPFIVTRHQSDASSPYYPLDMMETGGDLLYQWVGRMIMLGLYVTDEVPFRHVYLHGMVLDEQGRKMSKSKGNVINPLDIIEQYGSDAFRIGVCSNRSAGQNQAFSTPKVIAGRNFCNKLWNIARFIENNIDADTHAAPEPESLADHWVLRQLDTAREEIENHLKSYRFSEAIEMMYRVIWDDVADWYLEASKAAMNKPMLAYVLETCLKLAHPFAPFVTETIWTTLKRDNALLISSPWPKKVTYHELAAAEFDQLRSLVSEARYVAKELGGKQTMLYEHDTLIEENRAVIAKLVGLADVRHVVQPHGLRLAVPHREAWLDVSDDTLYEHQSKLELRLVGVRQEIEKLQKRLSNDSYVKNAPVRVVDETREQLASQQKLEQRLVAELDVID